MTRMYTHFVAMETFDKYLIYSLFKCNKHKIRTNMKFIDLFYMVHEKSVGLRITKNCKQINK